MVKVLFVAGFGPIVQDFGYRPQATHEANATALQSWTEWFEKGGKTVFE